MEVYPMSISCSSDEEDLDDYDDTPLFTREPSYRVFKPQDSPKSLSSLDTYKNAASNRNRDVRSSQEPPNWYLIYKTPRGSIHIKESRRRRSSLAHSSRLSYFQANLFATVLEDVLIQLHILDKCNNELRLSKIQSDMNELRGAKFGVKTSKIKDEIDSIDVKQVHSEHYKLFKLIDDRRSCDEIMKETYLDLSLNQRFLQLSKHTKSVTTRQLAYLKLIEDETRNKMRRRELIRNLRHQRNRMKSSVYETNAFVSDLINRIEDSSLQREVRDRYIDRWEGARFEQHTLRIQGKESGPSGAIAYYRRKCDEEQRAHNEVEALTNIQLGETLRLIEELMTKYDKDIETIDITMQRITSKLEDQIETRLNTEQTLVDHEKAIKEWVQFKEEREQARLYRLKMTNAAIAVQAWWRGLLVRLQLGPYNPKKRRPPPPPGKKKK